MSSPAGGSADCDDAGAEPIFAGRSQSISMAEGDSLSSPPPPSATGRTTTIPIPPPSPSSATPSSQARLQQQLYPPSSFYVFPSDSGPNALGGSVSPTKCNASATTRPGVGPDLGNSSSSISGSRRGILNTTKGSAEEPSCTTNATAAFVGHVSPGGQPAPSQLMRESLSPSRPPRQHLRTVPSSPFTDAAAGGRPSTTGGCGVRRAFASSNLADGQTGSVSVSGTTSTGVGLPTQGRVHGRPTSLLHHRPSSALSNANAVRRGSFSASSCANHPSSASTYHGTPPFGHHPLHPGSGSIAPSHNGSTSAAVLSNVYTVQLPEEDGGVEMAATRPLLLAALRARDTYKGIDKGWMELESSGEANTRASGSTNSSNGGSAPTSLQQVDGVFHWTDQNTIPVSYAQFCVDVMAVATCVQHPACLAASSYRLQVLEEKYHLHRLYNADVEERSERGRRGAVGGIPAGYPCRVDNCVAASTVMNAQWLVGYMQDTIVSDGAAVMVAEEEEGEGEEKGGDQGGGMEMSGEDKSRRRSSGRSSTFEGATRQPHQTPSSSTVIGGNGNGMTLERMCALLDFPDPYQLTVDALGLQPSVNRALPSYDALDPAINGAGRNSAALLHLFLTMRGGRSGLDYLAGAVQPTLARNELRTSSPQATELGLEFSGVLAQEWEKIAAWVQRADLAEFCTNQFQIYLPITRWCGGKDSHPGTHNAAANGGYAGVFGVASRVGGAVVADSDANAFLLSTQDRHSFLGSSNAYAASTMANNNNGSISNANATVPGGNSNTTSTSADLLVHDTYQQLLDHIFLPLFLATVAPADPRYADLAALLQRTGAVVLSGVESAKAQVSLRTGREQVNGVHDGSPVSDGPASGMMSPTDTSNGSSRARRPVDVPFTEAVSLAYLCYHIWANLCSLNALRRRRGLNVLQLRVVASSGTVATTSSPQDAGLLLLSYLLADVVVDAVALDVQPALQYLFGLHQIGIAACPLARCSLGMTNLSDHPVARLLWRGLRVSLCTLSPLYFHASSDALVEEYASAAKSHRLSPSDLNELALNSVVMSTFPDEIKAAWLGVGFVRDGWRANAAAWTKVPTARLQLRHASWAVERHLLASTTVERGGGGVARLSAEDPRTAASAEEQMNCDGKTDSSAMPPPPPVLSAASSPSPPPLQSAPYTVVDPAVDFARLVLTGPYDRDMPHAPIAHALHRALDLRHQYTTLPLPMPTVASGPSTTTAPSSTGGGDADNASPSSATAAVWYDGLAALIHDPQAVLPHPTESMGWAFTKNTAGNGNLTNGAAGTVGSPFDEDEWKYKTVEGVIVPHEVHQIPRLPQDLYHYEDFCKHVEELRRVIEHVRVREFALRRLLLLEHRFCLHAAVNHSHELGSTAARASQNRDFYHSTKVDNNIRMETGMTARQLLAFIVEKAAHSGDDIVSHPAGREPQTLRQLLAELHISATSLTVDDLNLQSAATHNPCTPDGHRDALLTLLLKTDNQMHGRYFAELTKRTFEELSRDQHTFTESRLPVYGASGEEWSRLSHWFDTHGMASSHNQWVVQVPRVYGVLRAAGKVASFAEYLEHIFEPLWRVSLHPSSDPRLFHFVNHIAAFDCVEDEHRPDMTLRRARTPPQEWTSAEEPPYNYYLYHLYANIRSLNRFRQRRRFSVFAFRPSCGEAGAVDHLIGGFLLAQNISYGVRLADSAPLQYLFYLAQIGVTVSPLSNNTKLQLNYLRNPFPVFFRRGLRVSLGTDSPLLYHHTQEPLLEEYSIASKIWKLSPNDLSETARNSVLLCNFSASFKADKLGHRYFLSSSAGNDVAKTHLSDVRVAYRFEAYHTEVGFLEYISGQHFHRALLTLEMEAQCKRLCGDIEEEEEKEEGSGRRKSSPGNERCAERSSEWGNVNAVAEERENSGGRGKRASAAGAGAGAAARGTHPALIDTAPKAADLARLQQQRDFLHRQLAELTGAVTSLHRQNHLLTSKLGEEQDRDQQATQLRRHRLGDKLRELQGLLEQKEMQPVSGSAEEQHHQQGQGLDEGRPSRGGGSGERGREAAMPVIQSHPSWSSASSAPMLPSATPTAAARRSNDDVTPTTGTTTFKSKRGDKAEGRVVTDVDGPTTTIATASAVGIVSTVRDRAPRESDAAALAAQTRRLLARSEDLWSSPAATGTGSARASLPPIGSGSPPSATKQRWSPRPSGTD